MKTSIIDRGKKINESKTFPFATSFTSLIIIANTKYVPKEPKKIPPKKPITISTALYRPILTIKWHSSIEECLNWSC